VIVPMPRDDDFSVPAEFSPRFVQGAEKVRFGIGKGQVRSQPLDKRERRHGRGRPWNDNRLRHGLAPDITD